MTTIDLETTIKELNGDVVYLDKSKNKPYIVREVFAQALGQQGPDEELDGAKKLKCYRLGTRLYAGETIKLDLDEASLLKERVGKFFGPIIYGQVCDILEQAGAKKAK